MEDIRTHCSVKWRIIYIYRLTISRYGNYYKRAKFSINIGLIQATFYYR